jgi:hypothetical protein
MREQARSDEADEHPFAEAWLDFASNPAIRTAKARRMAALKLLTHAANTLERIGAKKYRQTAVEDSVPQHASATEFLFVAY